MAGYHADVDIPGVSDILNVSKFKVKCLHSGLLVHRRIARGV
jgi:hypothetical protein